MTVEGGSVHSGYWGCGAFGGNRILMVAIQAIAAQMAGLPRLVDERFQWGVSDGN